jgi:hypothetical protein
MFKRTQSTQNGNQFRTSCSLPRKNLPDSLIVDTATGNDKNVGGLGAILCQTDEKGHNKVISCKQTITNT